MKTPTKPTLTKNVLALITYGSPLVGKETGVTRIVELGVPMGTAQRVIDEEQDVRLSTIDKLAEGLRVESWQLLVPGAARDALPELLKPDQKHLQFSPKAEDIAQRFDKLSSDEARRMAFAGIDHVLQLAERLQRASDAQPATEDHAGQDKPPPSPTPAR